MLRYFAALSLLSLVAAGQNLEFAQGQPGSGPPGWFVPQALRSMGYGAEFRSEGCRTGRCAVVTVPDSASPQSFGNLMQTLPAAQFKGKTVRLRAWVRLESKGSQDRAQMWLRVDRPNRQMGFFDNMNDRPVRSAAWTECTITGLVDADAETLNLGLMSIGNGRAWIDSVSLEVIPPASAAELAIARKELGDLYRRIDEAYSSARFDDIQALALPDAVAGSGLQRAPLKASLDELKAESVKGMQFTSRTTIVTLRLEGDEATVATRGEVTVAVGGETKRFIANSRDTWKHTGEGWKLRALIALSKREFVAPAYPATVEAVAAGLRRYAVPLAGVDPGAAFADLAPFGKAVGDARIVSLGEATHGTHEFFRMKHRLFEYLVKEKGFTVFAIEANWPESQAVDRYVKTGQGDPKAALAGMYFWTWNTQEVLDLIEWMRAFNKAPGKHATLTFTSFDMQTPDVASRQVLDYLRKAAPDDLARAQAAYASLNPVAAGGIVQLFDVNRVGFVPASSPEEWRDARQAAEIVRQAAALRAQAGRPDFRDEMMAQNVGWLATQVHPKEKMVLWAHNGHVRVSDAGGYKSMGARLRTQFGAAMYVVGFAFRRGTLRAIALEDGRSGGGPVPNTAPPAPEGSGDAVLSRVGMPLLFLNLRGVPATGALGKWLASPQRFYSAGAMWTRDDPEANVSIDALAGTYDGLIFVEESHAAAGLR